MTGVCVGGPGFDSTCNACVRSRASQAAGPAAGSPKYGIGPTFLGEGMKLTQFVQMSTEVQHCAGCVVLEHLVDHGLTHRWNLFDGPHVECFRHVGREQEKIPALECDFWMTSVAGIKFYERFVVFDVQWIFPVLVERNTPASETVERSLLQGDTHCGSTDLIDDWRYPSGII